MTGNSTGRLFRLTTFGASHDAAIGGVVEGCPAGLHLDLEAVQQELDRRRPGSTELGTARREDDRVELLSGVMDGVTLGTPIGFLIRNTDARPQDYAHLKGTDRPGHADLTWGAARSRGSCPPRRGCGCRPGCRRWAGCVSAIIRPIPPMPGPAPCAVRIHPPPRPWRP